MPRRKAASASAKKYLLQTPHTVPGIETHMWDAMKVTYLPRLQCAATAILFGYVCWSRKDSPAHQWQITYSVLEFALLIAPEGFLA